MNFTFTHGVYFTDIFSEDKHYSNLNASTGFKFAAFCAGYIPKNIPTKHEKVNPKMAAQ